MSFIQGMFDLIEFINEHDPRYTAEHFVMNEGEAETDLRVVCKARDGSDKARWFSNVTGYVHSARQEVKDPVFLAALKQWHEQRLGRAPSS